MDMSKEYSALFQIAEGTVAHARRVMPLEIETDAVDQKYTPLLCIGHKVVKSTEAVILLCRQGYGEDAAVVTRSIVEAVINARLIEHLDIEEGVKKFAAYEVAVQWRHFLRLKKIDPEYAKEAFGPEDIQWLKTRFEGVKDWFLKDLQKEIDDPENISHHWHTKRKTNGKLEVKGIFEVATMLDSLEAQKEGVVKADFYKFLMRSAYGLGSDYVHSNAVAIEAYMSSEGTKIIFHSAPSDNVICEFLWSAVCGLVIFLEIWSRIEPQEKDDDLKALVHRLREVAD